MTVPYKKEDSVSRISELQHERIHNLEGQIEKVNSCDHPKKEIRSKGPHYAFQCLRCGDWVGGWLKHSQVINKESVKPFDEGLRERYFETVREMSRDLMRRKREIEKTDFDTWYAEYLDSPEWAEKRSLVLTRCNSICEGCGKRAATVVHHTTYMNVGREFLFELLGLCRQCHDAIHGVK